MITTARPPAPWWATPLTVACTIALASGLAAAVARQLPSGLDHPDRWDPRVAGLAAFVEEARDLRFAHPVEVVFLGAAAYSEQTRGAVTELTEADRESYEHDAGLLRALGLASGKIDLAAANDEVADEGTLAFYSPAEQRVRVRGTKLTPALRATVVHELTHALQDQHFDLERIDRMESSGAVFAFRTLAEGDALRIEELYVDNELSERERRQAERVLSGDGDAGDEPLKGVPDGLIAIFSAPYALGQPFVAALGASGDDISLDDAFADPPVADEHVLDVLSFLAGDEPEPVEPLDPGSAGELIDRGEVGALTWYLLLATRISPLQALAASDGWGGDTYVRTLDDDVVCVMARFVGDTERDGDEMHAALTAWAEALAGDQEVRRAGEAIEMRACDPGPDAPPAGRSAVDVLGFPALRGFLIAGVLPALEPDEARCYARRVLAGLALEQVLDPDERFFGSEGFQRRLRAAVGACRH